MDNDASDSVGASGGTLQGGAGFTTSAEVGSHALSLDGADDYVDLTSHAASFPLGDAARSITGWFRADAGSQGQSFFAYGTNAAGKRISIAADRTEASVSVSGHEWGVRSLGLSEGWHHIAVTYPARGQSDDFSIYIDGQLQSSITLSGTVRTVDTGAGVAYIGRSAGSSSDYYGGVIDDLRIYDGELSSGRVLELASDRERVAHWQMDNDANDSVDARHGTLQGEAGFTTSAAIGSHALSLDGDDDYVDLTAHAADLPQGDAARSIAGWFRADDPLPRTYTFFGYGINANGRIFSITANQDQVSVDVRGHQWGMTGLGLTEGWHHIAVTFPAGATPMTSLST